MKECLNLKLLLTDTRVWIYNTKFIVNMMCIIFLLKRIALLTLVNKCKQHDFKYEWNH